MAFDFQLDIRPYLAPGAPPPAATTYHLCAVVVHSGSMRGGHYVAYVSRAAVSGACTPGGAAAAGTAGERWYCISDTSVKSVSAAEVAACQAYMLLYCAERSEPAEAAQQREQAQRAEPVKA